ncbi:unnamed protein product [marine sediment metagenome]|uniref:EF-hand domain-containing protein n=1 Tax=marine sediment metagenome TaxID=412755 RepID=X1RGM8_9ZZZZ
MVKWANINLSVIDAETKTHLSGARVRIDHENGSWAQNLNFSSPDSFDGELCGFTAGTITITAEKEGYVSFSQSYTLKEGANNITVEMVTAAPPFDPWSYDFNGNGIIDTNEMLAATNDYFAGIITKSQLDQVVALWEQAPPPPFDPWSYDFNSDGYIDDSERAQAGFDYFDGIITQDQLNQVLALPAPPEPPPPPVTGLITLYMTGVSTQEWTAGWYYADEDKFRYHRMDYHGAPNTRWRAPDDPVITPPEYPIDLNSLKVKIETYSEIHTCPMTGYKGSCKWGEFGPFVVEDGGIYTIDVTTGVLSKK